MRFELGAGLAQVKAKALAKIDSDAEAARLRFVTPGAGQAMEYQATEAEARRYAAAGFPVPLDSAAYPFLWAEVSAQESARAGAVVDPRSIAELIVAQADQWVAIGSEIKRLRREAKLRIEIATTVAEVRQAENVSWPAPIGG